MTMLAMPGTSFVVINPKLFVDCFKPCSMTQRCFHRPASACRCA